MTDSRLSRRAFAATLAAAPLAGAEAPWIDLFDGRTNREAWSVYGSREIWPNTDFNLTLFLSDALEKSQPAYDDSVVGSERIRLQADVVVRF